MLTPYRAQRRELAQAFSRSSIAVPRDIATTDEFQGMENDIVIISLVHSGVKGPSLHLSSSARITVLTSRARHSLIMVGSKATYAASSSWTRVLQLTDLSQTPVHPLWLAICRLAVLAGHDHQQGNAANQAPLIVCKLVLAKVNQLVTQHNMAVDEDILARVIKAAQDHARTL